MCDLLERLKAEKKSSVSGGIYHKIQIELTYNSNHIEGSKLTHDQTRYIFETNTIGVENDALNVDDIIETANHFGSLSIVVVKKIHKVIDNRIMIINDLVKQGRFCMRKREEYAF